MLHKFTTLEYNLSIIFNCTAKTPTKKNFVIPNRRVLLTLIQLRFTFNPPHISCLAARRISLGSIVSARFSVLMTHLYRVIDNGEERRVSREKWKLGMKIVYNVLCSVCMYVACAVQRNGRARGVWDGNTVGSTHSRTIHSTLASPQLLGAIDRVEKTGG